MKKINTIIDLTLLDEHASMDQIKQLITQATEQQVAAICVYPKHLTYLPREIKRATVLNFPSGSESHEKVQLDLKQIIQYNLAEEIDYVFPYPLFLNEQAEHAFSQYHDIAQKCIKNGLLLKVIIETGALTKTDIIEKLSSQLIEKGCKFIKTSTGKTPVGATLEAAEAILTAIKKSGAKCGFKASGGIRTDAQALSYIHLAEKILSYPVDSSWFRIGRSIRF